MAQKLTAGDQCPVFKLKNESDELFDIANVLGKKNLVVYFYPKDDTPGCTKEACSFRDQYAEFEDLGAEVIGISSDSPSSHAEFKTKYRLPYTLLSDEENRVRKQFGVGKTLGLLPGRVTYVIDKTGTIRYVFNSQFQALKHIEEAMKTLKEIEA